MLHTSRYPLRTTTGRAISVQRRPNGAPDVTIRGQSHAARLLNLDYRIRAYQSNLEALEDTEVARFLPSIGDSNPSLPGIGVATMPAMPALPFGAVAPLLSMMVLSKEASPAEPRAFQVTLTIKLAETILVGGVCFGGYPYLSTYQSSTDSSVSNFGLPREFRLTPVGHSSDSSQASPTASFLDAEVSVTRQEPLSHSGAHYLSCDPTLTDTIDITLADWPAFYQRIRSQPDAADLRYGFVIPYFYVFEHREGTRYRPDVAFGLLAASSNTSQLPAATAGSDTSELVLRRRQRYFPFSAASLTNGGRSYSAPPPIIATVGGNPAANYIGLKECFISRSLATDESVVLFLEQSEQYDRCLSGVRMFPLFIPEPLISQEENYYGEGGGVDSLPESNLSIATLASQPRSELETRLRSVFRLPSSVNFSESVGVRVWEIDPPDGATPTQISLGSSHTVLLADVLVDTIDEILGSYLSGIRFRHASSAHFLAIELTNRCSESSRIVVAHLGFVQSAHVVINSRPSRSQQIGNLNFRLIGETLGEDLSKLGDEGFHFSVEHWVAGERKSVLFRATSVFDLVHSGVARLSVNQRRRASEYETSDYGPNVDKGLGDARMNFDERHSEGTSLGWRRSEYGKELEWVGSPWLSPTEQQTADGHADFVSISNQETRSHVTYVYPDVSVPEWNAAAIFANGLAVAFEGGSIVNAILTGNDSGLVLPTYKANSTEQLVLGFKRAWKGFSPNALRGLRVEGMTSIVQSPYCLTSISGRAVRDLIEGVSGAIAVGGDVLNGGALDFNLLVNTLTDLGNVGGLAALLGGMLLPIPANPLPSVLASMFALNGLTINVSATAAGAGVTFGSAPGNLLPVVTKAANAGTQGTISKLATRSNHAYNQSLVTGAEQGDGTVNHVRGLMKRRVKRSEVLGDDRRVRGAEVVWQDRVTDVVSGIIPINISMPALADRLNSRSTDDSIRVRLGSGIGEKVSADFWFDVVEGQISHDR